MITDPIIRRPHRPGELAPGVSWQDALWALGPLIDVEIGVHPDDAEALSSRGRKVPELQTGVAPIDAGAENTR